LYAEKMISVFEGGKKAVCRKVVKHFFVSPRNASKWIAMVKIAE
jgi:hypothetical protein